jgi:hypothetical protein
LIEGKVMNLRKLFALAVLIAVALLVVAQLGPSVLFGG